MQLEPIPYVVSNGETLTKIAAKNKLSSWRSIYDANCNNFLRLLRPDPDKIKVGDRLFIPPKASDIALYRIEKLKKIRDENDATFKSILKQWDREYQKVIRISNNVDTIADIAIMFNGLTFECIDAYKKLQMTGEQLAKATNSFVRSFVFNRLQFLSELTLKAANFTDIKGDESTALLITKVVIQSWFDMQTPSYWTKRISGVDIEAINRNTRDQIISQQQAITQQLDQRIAEAQKELDLALQVERML